MTCSLSHYINLLTFTATGESHDAYNQVYSDDQPNESSFGHELVAGGAAFAGFKAFEDHQRKEGTCTTWTVSQPVLPSLTHPPGKPVNHQFAKELLAGFAGAEVDKLAETKGMDFYDKERAKSQAKENAEQMYDDHYGQYDQYDPNQQGPPERLNNQFGGDRWGGGGGY